MFVAVYADVCSVPCLRAQALDAVLVSRGVSPSPERILGKLPRLLESAA